MSVGGPGWLFDGKPADQLAAGTYSVHVNHLWPGPGKNWLLCVSGPVEVEIVEAAPKISLMPWPEIEPLALKLANLEQGKVEGSRLVGEVWQVKVTGSDGKQVDMELNARTGQVIRIARY